MYCYRQYLELKIKLITSRISHYHGIGSASYRRCHDLEQLFSEMEDAANQAAGDHLHTNDSEREAFNQVRSVVNELNRIDPRGVGFRYPEEVTVFEVAPFRVRRMMGEVANYFDALHDYVTDGER